MSFNLSTRKVTKKYLKTITNLYLFLWLYLFLVFSILSADFFIG